MRANRRAFLKALAIAPLMGVRPDNHYLLAASPPSREDDDTEYLQWHIDNGVEVPQGMYTISDTLIVGATPQSALICHNSFITKRGAVDPMIFAGPAYRLDMPGTKLGRSRR